jgi:hypothetical protein
MLDECTRCPRWCGKVVRTVGSLMSLRHHGVRSVLHTSAYPYLRSDNAPAILLKTYRLCFSPPHDASQVRWGLDF